MLADIESKIRKVLMEYPIKKAALFGSAARSNMTEQSDIDMLVEFFPNSRGLDFFGLRIDLEEALGCSVDLVTFNALSKSKPSFRQNVENEARLIYEHQGA